MSNNPVLNKPLQSIRKKDQLHKETLDVQSKIKSAILFVIKKLTTYFII